MRRHRQSKHTKLHNVKNVLLVVDHVSVVVNMGLEVVKLPLLSSKVSRGRSSGKAGIASAHFLVSTWMHLAVVLLFGCAGDDVGRQPVVLMLVATNTFLNGLLELNFVMVFIDLDSCMTVGVTRRFKVSALQKTTLEHDLLQGSSEWCIHTRRRWP